MSRHLSEMEIKDFYLNVGLYETVEFTDAGRAANLIGGELTFDCYCPECNDNSTFRAPINERFRVYMANKNNALSSPGSLVGTQYPASANYEELFLKENTYIIRKLFCARNTGHEIAFCIKVTDSSITKIGQFPSLADIEGGTLQKYRKILGKDYSDFSRAIGLFANEIGIGSYVYLRRIIERLIEEAHIIKSKVPDWDEQQYQKSRFGEKIDILSDVIDADALNFLKPIYGILSKGVHELSEEECKEHFYALRVAIEFILDDKLVRYGRELKKKNIASSLSGIASNIK